MQLISVAANIIKREDKLMCEAAVFLVTQGAEKEVMKEVSTLEVMDDRLFLSDILGERMELKARIKNIDFLEHKVILEAI